jgi:hypothetical protein
MVEEMNESMHPVLETLKTRIELLEQEVQAKQDNVDSLRNDFKLLQDRGIQYAERVKTVVYDLYKDGGYDEDTLLAVMRNLDIDTRASKKFEVNVTFEIELEYALGEEIDKSNLEWDLEFDVKSGDYEVLDYRSDILWSNEV